jgi:phosphoglycerate dehydrogenase-like enzyme
MDVAGDLARRVPRPVYAPPQGPMGTLSVLTPCRPVGRATLTAVTDAILVIGRQAGMFPPGLPEQQSGARYAFAADEEAARAAIGDAEVVFHFGDPQDALRRVWPLAKRLRWLHVGGVGVDWALFPELVESDVVVTNSRGVFDVTLPEYATTLMLALAKDLRGTIEAQARNEWRHRLLEPLAGSRALILGAGSIARATGRLLHALGVSVTLVGRRERPAGPGGTGIRAAAELPGLLAETDWLIVLAPLTAETRGLIGAAELARLPRGARLLNLGRGPIVDEAALLDALRSGHLAGAALDVFAAEPLPPGHPLWSAPGVIVSPHIGGDVSDTLAAFTRAFLANLGRYRAGEPLLNVVDKRLGYVPSGD